ncbi:MAG: LEA type 2 family protein [bacterium]
MNSFLKSGRVLSTMLLVLMLGGCAGGALKMPEAPSVGIASMKLLSPGLRSQTFRIGLNLKNPNNFPLPLRGFSYQLTLNGVDVAQGVNSQSINLPAGGSSELSMDISLDTLTLFSRLKNAGLLSGKPIQYGLKGNVGLVSQGLTLPFSRTGEVSVSR